MARDEKKNAARFLLRTSEMDQLRKNSIPRREALCNLPDPAEYSPFLLEPRLEYEPQNYEPIKGINLEKAIGRFKDKKKTVGIIEEEG
jgi:hypothetical protein